jgi:hypothetical protein
MGIAKNKNRANQGPQIILAIINIHSAPKLSRLFFKDHLSIKIFRMVQNNQFFNLFSRQIINFS